MTLLEKLEKNDYELSDANRLYTNIYNHLYDKTDNETYNMLLNCTDEHNLFNNYKDFIKALNDYRKDLFTSDREIVALFLTVHFLENL